MRGTKYWNQNQSQEHGAEQSCSKCGYCHVVSNRCPACGKKCSKCNKWNHFAAVCHSSQSAKTYLLQEDPFNKNQKKRRRIYKFRWFILSESCQNRFKCQKDHKQHKYQEDTNGPTKWCWCRNWTRQWFRCKFDVWTLIQSPQPSQQE